MRYFHIHPSAPRSARELIQRELDAALGLRVPVTLAFLRWACAHHGFPCPSAAQVDAQARRAGLSANATSTEWRPAHPAPRWI